MSYGKIVARTKINKRNSPLQQDVFISLQRNQLNQEIYWMFDNNDSIGNLKIKLYHNNNQGGFVEKDNDGIPIKDYSPIASYGNDPEQNKFSE